MYDKLTDLAFTNAYVGVVLAEKPATDDHYASMKNRAPQGMTSWYYRHTKGLLWIATADEHAESVTAWLHRAQSLIPCTTTLAALIDNGTRLPPTGDIACAYRIPRVSITTEVAALLEDCFTIYYPHSDEFLVIIDMQEALARHQKSPNLPDPLTIHRFTDCVADARARLDRAYDPLEAQIGEVLGPITDAGAQAAADLLRVWPKYLGNVIPDDVQHLETAIIQERERLRDRRRVVREKRVIGDFLVDVDRYAQWVRSLRWTAFDLQAKIRDYKLPGRSSDTYEDAVTPLMLAAMRRYTEDLAEQIGLQRYALVPVLGRDFEMARRIFPEDDSNPTHRTTNTIIIEIPGETRLRLGALPLIARSMSTVMTEKVERIALTFGDIERRGNPSLDLLLPRLHVRDGHSVISEVEHHHRRVTAVAKEIAADLLATAIAGPAFVFAMARFAVGHLDELRSNGTRDAVLPSFRLRLRACLGLLAGLGIESGFESIYLPEGPLELPAEIVNVVRDTAGNVQQDEAELDRVSARLSTGRMIADARPAAILAALWRAVARRSGYLHEIAALMSVAHSQAAGGEILS